jgi:GNAT superfamily N-acetyltransferase
MARARDEIERASEVFVRGFCAGRSLTYPFEYERIEGLWVMRDAPRRNPRKYRNEEWIAYRVAPREADAVARRHTRGRYFICAIQDADESQPQMPTEFKRLGYRLLTTEPFFVHRLRRVPRRKAPAKIVRVRSKSRAEQFAKATRTRPIPSQLLTSTAPFRQYIALDEDEVVGWVRSVDAGDSTWCANLYVEAHHRRRGIGAALLAKMLRDDRTRGADWSVLLSSHAGALLYPQVGYEQIGTLLMFAPKKR